jgi:RNA polymerase-binding transcription factor DksA
MATKRPADRTSASASTDTAGRKAAAKKAASSTSKPSATSKKAAAAKAPAKKASAKKAPAKKTAEKKAPAKKTAAKKSATAPKKAAAGPSAAKKSAGGAKKASAPPTVGTEKAAARSAASPSGRSTRSVPAPRRGTSDTVKSEPTVPTPDASDEAAFLQDSEWIESQRRELVRMRAEYTRNADRLAQEAASLMADREPGDVQFDEESGEGDTLAVERDRDLALSAAARQAVQQIDEALLRIEAGTYGICVVTGAVIPQERLEAIPETPFSVAAKLGVSG